MILSKQRLAFWTLVLGGAVLIYGALALFAAVIAHADPVVTATQTTDNAWALIETHGWMGGALLAYGGLATFLKANDSKHWIAQGRLLAIITGSAGLLGTLAAWKFSGGSLDAVLGAVIGLIALVVRPTVGPAPVKVEA